MKEIREYILLLKVKCYWWRIPLATQFLTLPPEVNDVKSLEPTFPVIFLYIHIHRQIYKRYRILLYFLNICEMVLFFAYHLAFSFFHSIIVIAEYFVSV